MKLHTRKSNFCFRSLCTESGGKNTCSHVKNKKKRNDAMFCDDERVIAVCNTYAPTHIHRTLFVVRWACDWWRENMWKMENFKFTMFYLKQLLSLFLSFSVRDFLLFFFPFACWQSRHSADFTKKKKRRDCFLA